MKFISRKPKPRAASVAPLKEAPTLAAKPAGDKPADKPASKPRELGGPSGPEPTRYGDWERKGICVDF
ncbi:succinate dehydrogenase assembly factor 4 [Pelagibius sp. 7325]|uniref:DUF1674 domain-containing protein n=1 Tax=Pelagibius sp. 7325 TaxID=3131994 RepID=UPI0030EED6E4